MRNSISQLQDFVRAAFETLDRDLPAGVYNITNHGAIRTSEIIDAMRRHGILRHEPRFFDSESDFMSTPGRVYRASCILSAEKIRSSGISIPDVHEALEYSLRHWQESSN